jgi:hypothetical protein
MRSEAPTGSAISQWSVRSLDFPVHISEMKGGALNNLDEYLETRAEAKKDN